MALPNVRWALADLDADSRRSALDALSASERGRYEGTDTGQQDAFLAGRMVLRGLVGQLTGAAPADVMLEAMCPDCGGPHGRPVLSDSSLRLSLSHGGGIVVAAAAWDTPIGIDVEAAVVDPARLEAIATFVGRASVEQWTRVEAVLKADGRGLRVDPSRVTIVGDRGWIDDSTQRYNLSEVDIAPSVRVSVAIAA